MVPIMKTFSYEMERIYDQIHEMGKLTLQQMNLIQENFEMITSKKSQEIFLMDQVVDKKDEEIQREILNLMVVQTPLPKELESLTVMLRMSREFERIGDQMVNIAESFQHIHFDAPHSTIANVFEMLNHTIFMHQETLKLLGEYEKSRAENIRISDEKVDSLFHEFREELPSLVRKYDTNIDSLIQFFLISRYLERSADHLVNISKRITLIKE